MVTIICGSRHCNDYAFVSRAIAESGFTISYVLEGGARGVDALAKRWAIEHGVRWREYEAAWYVHGKAAGPIRNRKMSKAALELSRGAPVQCIAIMAVGSKGTRDMVNVARSLGFKVFIKEWLP